MAKGNPLRRLIREYPGSREFHDAHEELHVGSDRSCAILAGAALETVILLAFPQRDHDSWEKLTGEGRALSGLYNKTHLACAMGLIEEATRDDLDIIRNIRNVFSHAMGHVSFITPAVAEACGTLQTDAAYRKPTLDPNLVAPPERQRFVAVAEEIGHLLLYKMIAMDEEERGGEDEEE